MSRYTAPSDYDYRASMGDVELPETGPCESCEGSAYCVACGYERIDCICQPKIQDLDEAGQWGKRR